MSAGLKLGGDERGGKIFKASNKGEHFLHNAVNLTYMVNIQVPVSVGGKLARSNGSCIKLNIFCRRSVVNGSAHRPIVPSRRCSEKTY